MRSTLILLGAVSLLALIRPAQSQVFDHGDGNFTVSGTFVPVVGDLPYRAVGGTDPTPEILVESTTNVVYHSFPDFFYIETDGYTVTVEDGASIRNTSALSIFTATAPGSHTVFNIAGELEAEYAAIIGYLPDSTTWDVTLSGTLRSPTPNAILLGQFGSDRLTMQPGSLIESGDGYIELRGGADEVIFNGGVFDGLARIDFGSGNDLLELNASPIGAPNMRGGGGTDTVRLNNSGNFSLTALESSWDYLEMDGSAWTLSGRTNNVFNGGVSIIPGGTLTLEITGGDQVIASSITGGGVLSKSGDGKLTLTGDSSGFAGETLVEGGTLLVNGALGLATATLSVAPGGTLGGAGTFGGNATVDGILSAGNSPGTLTVAGDLTLGGGSTSVFELNTPGVVGGLGVTGNDLVDVGGSLTLGGTLDARAAAAGYYRLFDYGGTLTGAFADGTITGTGGFVPLAPGNPDIRYDVPNQVNLSVLGAGQSMQFWDGANTAADGMVNGGAGTWAGFGTNWTNAAGSANSGWGGSVGVFAGASGGVVTVDGTQSFDTLQFSTNGYILTGDTLRLSPASGAAGTLSIDNGITTTVGSVIADHTGSALRKTGGGTLVLSGANTYSGGTQLLGGTLSVSSDANLGAAAGGLSFDGGTLQVTGTGLTTTGRAITLGANSGGFDIGDAANTFTLGQDITGAGDLVKQGAGTLVLGGTNDYGSTLIEAGTLIGNAGSISGDIANAGTVTFDQVAGASFAGDITGLAGTDGTMVKHGAGTLMLDGLSTLGWTIAEGGLVTAAGRFSGDADIASGASLTFNQSANATYAGTLSGSGALIMNGAGSLLYDGDGSGFTGNTTVADGRLIVGSSAAHANAVLAGSFEVQGGGVIGGHGAVGAGVGSTVTVASGGMIAPGNSIGTLTVDGDIAFAAGSNYEVEVDPAGAASDLIHATGQARLNGASISHVGLAGTYDPFSTYTILTADGGIDGAFGDVTSVYAFLTPELSYGATSVFLKLTRNKTDFAVRARTFNQYAVAESAESLDPGNAIYQAIAKLPDDDTVIRTAFDALSGELHASAKAALIEGSHFVRDAVNDRIRSAFGGISASAAPVLAYGPADRTLAAADTERFATWGHVFGAWDSFKSNGNAAGMDASTGGLVTGIDGVISSNVRLGLMAGYSRSSFDSDDRASSGNSDNYHLGLYGGGRWDALRVSGGLAYTWHEIETNRSVAFNGFADSLSADYHAATFQAFGEVGYRIDTDSASFEPFAGLAYVNLDTDGFRETGGSAALTANGTTTETTFATLGLRAETEMPIGAMEAKLHGTLGWQHAFGDVVPSAGLAFASSDAFTIKGTPIAEDAAIIEAGLDLNLPGNATFGLAYSGQLAGPAQRHGVSAKLVVGF